MTVPAPAFMSADEIGAPKRARPIQVEHIIQKHAKLWVREALAVDHEFFAFDRSGAGGRFTHAREKARGLQANTPDTLLKIADRVGKWCEFKRPGKEPTPDQYRMGERLAALGDVWFWAVSVEQYYRELLRLGVPMRPSAAFLAQHHDASVASEIAKAEMKAGRLPKRYKAAKARAVKPSARAVARSHRTNAVRLGLG